MNAAICRRFKCVRKVGALGNEYIVQKTGVQNHLNIAIVGFHMTSLNFKLKNYPSNRDFAFTIN